MSTQAEAIRSILRDARKTLEKANRWPSGAPGGKGGQFAPKATTSGSASGAPKKPAPAPSKSSIDNKPIDVDSINQQLKKHPLFAKLDADNQKSMLAKYAAAAADHPAFESDLLGLAKLVGGAAEFPPKEFQHDGTGPLKGVDRSLAKVVSDYDGDASQLADTLRATISVDSLKGANTVIDRIRSQYEVIEKRSRNLLDPNVEPIDGYRDAKFVVKTKNGAMAEIQVNVPDMLWAKNKGGGHKLYEDREAFTRGLAKDKDTWTPDQKRVYDDMNAQMRALYSPAWRKVSSFSKSLADTYTPFRIAESIGNSLGGDLSQARQPGHSGWPTVIGKPSTFIKTQTSSISDPPEDSRISQASLFQEAERALFAVRENLQKLDPSRKPRRLAEEEPRTMKSTSIDALRASMALTKARLLLLKAQQRYPAGTPGGLGGQFMPMGRAGGGGGAAPARPDISRWRQDHPSVVRANNRLDALQGLAQAGNIDAIRNFPTSTANSYARVVADHRTALLQHFEPAARLARARGTMPQPPDIIGANMQNSALISARRHIERLTFIAQNAPDPGLALSAFTVTGGGRTNSYLQQAHNYHQALIAHFAQGEGAQPGAARPQAAAPQRPAPQPAPAPAPAPAPVAPTTTTTAPPLTPPASNQHTQPFHPAIGVQNTTYVQAGQTLHVGQAAADRLLAANPGGLSVNELGFVPRPNVPLTSTVRRNGIDENGQLRPFTNPSMQALATAYLSQPTGLQSRAREYQQGRWVPDTPEARARAAEAQRQQDIQAQEAARVALEQEASRRSAIPAEWQPRSTVGANVTRMNVSGSPERNTLPTSVFRSTASAKAFAKRIIADYGGGVTFSAGVQIEGNSAEVSFTGSDGTSIRRVFSKDDRGNLSVYHAYFRAGSQGNASGKRFFRVAFGEYQAMGMKSVNVSANIDVGGYAWARYGFLPKTDAVWQSLGNTIRSNARNQLQQGNISRDAYARIEALTNDSDKRNLWKVADLQENGQSIGSKLLMNTHWSGTIDMTNQEQMTRFAAYTSDENIQRGSSRSRTS